MTFKEILNRTTLELRERGLPNSELDARVLLEKSLEKDSIFIFANPDRLITNLEYSRFRRYIRKRKKGESVALILRHKEFYGLDFYVNKNVLVPRPESEYLVEKSLKLINKKIAQNTKDKIKILDMGTGSGCIIISIAQRLIEKYSSEQMKQFVLYASEISQKALSVAQKNSRIHKVRKYIKFYFSDLFSNKRLPKKFDLIVANLPYVPRPKNLNKKNLIEKGIYFEPEQAIFADNNGKEVIQNFLNHAKGRINPNGAILIELDPRNATALYSLAKKIFKNTVLEKDLARLNRYLIIRT